MLWRIRKLLVCLLILALPMQGATAAAMSFCGASHHAGAPTAVSDHAGLTGHVHGDHSAHAADAHQGDGASVPVADAPTAAAQADIVLADAHKCSVCGSCCSTGALVSSMPGLPVVDAEAAAFVGRVISVDTVARDGPDRPPRSSLA
ncbi:MAG: hypothetical protein ACKVQR_12675 [Aquabacterium sp.]